MLTVLPSASYSLTLSQSRPLRYGVFFYLYVMQGIPSGFYLTALANYFTAEGVKPNVVGSFIAIIGLPWAFQFIWGPLIDRFQGSPMGRRKPWVVGSQLMTLLASCILLVVGNPVAQISTLAWLFCLRSLFAAIQDASVDAMAITVIPEDERGRVNAFMRAGFLVGTGIGAAVFATILRRYGFHGAALTQVGFLLTGVLLMVFIREKPGDRLLPSFGRAARRGPFGDLYNNWLSTIDKPNLTATESQPNRGDGPRGDGPRGDGPRGDGPRGDGPRGDGPRGDGPRGDGPRGDGPRGDGPRGDGPRGDGSHDFRWLFTELFRGLFARQSLLLFGAILLAYTSNALFLRAYNHHLIERLGWLDTDVSVLTGTYGMIVATIIALTGGYLADRLGARRLLVIMLALVAVYLIGFNLLSAFWVQRDVARTGLVALYFLDPAVSAAAMPVLMGICRKGVEGSQFTTYMAFVNLSDIAGTYFAGQALLLLTAPTIGLFAGGLAVIAMIAAVFIVRHYRTVV